MEKVIKLKVVDVIKETGTAISIHFKQPFLKKVKYKPGQFLTLLVPVNGTIERRCYSLNSAPKIDKTISVTVKKVKDGKVSNHLFDQVKVGDTIKALSPMGSFTIDPDLKAQRHVVLFGAGSGITPLMSILKTILQVEAKSIVSLFYGNRDEESIIFDESLKKFKEKFPERLHLVHILSNPADPASHYKGRVERDQIPGLLAQVPDYGPENTLYYICG
ncbi:MAG: FAD-binding oxidoreductase, partial [Myxococcota bacterium]